MKPDCCKLSLFYGFVDSGETCIIKGTTKEDGCYEYVFE